MLTSSSLLIQGKPFSSPRSKTRGMAFDKLKAVSASNELNAPSKTEGFSLPTGRQGLILHFNRLSVQSLSKEAAPFTLS
jgi:hypothetical protein